MTHEISRDRINKIVDQLVESNSWSKTKPATPPKPRNFVAKNAINSGAGSHKNKKKEANKGNVKHKNKAFEESKYTELNLDLRSLTESEFYKNYMMTKEDARQKYFQRRQS